MEEAEQEVEGGWVSHWNPDSHPDSYPPIAVSCPGAGHMCQLHQPGILGTAFVRSQQLITLAEQPREQPSCPPLLLDLPVGSPDNV